MSLLLFAELHNRKRISLKDLDLETSIGVLTLLGAVSWYVLGLVQQGKVAGMGASFAGGAAGSLVGSRGSANFLSRTTAVLGATFFMSSLVVTCFAGQPVKAVGVMKTQQKLQVIKPVVPVDATAPAAPAGPVVPGNAGSKAGEIPK